MNNELLVVLDKMDCVENELMRIQHGANKADSYNDSLEICETLKKIVLSSGQIIEQTKIILNKISK